MSPRVVLIGPPGAGKSTIGRRVANALDLPLLDTDAEIERVTGRTIPEIFSQDGEPAFREIEEEVVARALDTHDGVVSLGGGAILSERTRARLAGHTVVYLEISVAEGLRRTGAVGAAGTRPLLAGGDPAQVVLTARATDVDTVIVAGQMVVRESRHRLGDVGRLLAEAIDPLIGP